MNKRIQKLADLVLATFLNTCFAAHQLRAEK